MRIVIAFGVAFMLIVVLFFGMLLPDTFESWAFSKVATYADNMKRARIIESPEYGELDAENARLNDELRACFGQPPVEEEVKSSFFGFINPFD